MESSYKIAGIDVHKKMLAVVISEVAQVGEFRFARRKFATGAMELQALAKWLAEQEVREAVMESTAQYWKPVWQALEGQCRLQLAQAHSNRAPKGRKRELSPMPSGWCAQWRGTDSEFRALRPFGARLEWACASCSRHCPSSACQTGFQYCAVDSMTASRTSCSASHLGQCLQFHRSGGELASCESELAYLGHLTDDYGQHLLMNINSRLSCTNFPSLLLLRTGRKSVPAKY